MQEPQKFDDVEYASSSGEESLSQGSKKQFLIQQFQHSSISSDGELKNRLAQICNDSLQSDPLKLSTSFIFNPVVSKNQRGETWRPKRNFRFSKFEEEKEKSKKEESFAPVEEQLNMANNPGNMSMKSSITMPLRVEETKRIQKMMKFIHEKKISESVGFRASKFQHQTKIINDVLDESQVEWSSEKCDQPESRNSEDRILSNEETSFASRITKPKNGITLEQQKIFENIIQEETIEKQFIIPEIEIDEFPSTKNELQLQKRAAKLFLKFIRIKISEGNIKIGKLSNDEIKFFSKDNLIAWRRDGYFYLGGMKEGQKEGIGIQIIPGKEKYYGQFRKNFRSGRGRVMQVEGKEYIGEWAHDKRNGRGVEKELDNSMYSGLWKNDEYHGFGKHLSSNGQYYKGNFEGGFKHGKGIWFETREGKGDFYEGSYFKGKKHGYGEYHYESGNVFKGCFMNGIMQKEIKNLKINLQKKKNNSVETIGRKEKGPEGKEKERNKKAELPYIERKRRTYSIGKMKNIISDQNVDILTQGFKLMNKKKN